jgi:hypothetical protein
MVFAWRTYFLGWDCNWRLWFKSLGGLGGVSFFAQVIGTFTDITVDLLGIILIFDLMGQFINIK